MCSIGPENTFFWSHWAQRQLMQLPSTRAGPARKLVRDLVVHQKNMDEGYDLDDPGKLCWSVCVLLTSNRKHFPIYSWLSLGCEVLADGTVITIMLL